MLFFGGFFLNHEGNRWFRKRFLSENILHENGYSSCEWADSCDSLQRWGLKKTRESKYKNVVGERVRLARVALKPPVSQEDLSGRLARRGIQITQTGISKIENRSRYVMDYEAQVLAKILKVSIAWLYGENEKQ